MKKSSTEVFGVKSKQQMIHGGKVAKLTYTLHETMLAYVRVEVGGQSDSMLLLYSLENTRGGLLYPRTTPPPPLHDRLSRAYKRRFGFIC